MLDRISQNVFTVTPSHFGHLGRDRTTIRGSGVDPKWIWRVHGRTRLVLVGEHELGHLCLASLIDAINSIIELPLDFDTLYPSLIDYLAGLFCDALGSCRNRSRLIGAVFMIIKDASGISSIVLIARVARSGRSCVNLLIAEGTHHLKWVLRCLRGDISAIGLAVVGAIGADLCHTNLLQEIRCFLVR